MTLKATQGRWLKEPHREKRKGEVRTSFREKLLRSVRFFKAHAAEKKRAANKFLQKQTSSSLRVSATLQLIRVTHTHKNQSTPHLKQIHHVKPDGKTLSMQSVRTSGEGSRTNRDSWESRRWRKENKHRFYKLFSWVAVWILTYFLIFI